MNLFNIFLLISGQDKNQNNNKSDLCQRYQIWFTRLTEVQIAYHCLQVKFQSYWEIFCHNVNFHLGCKMLRNLYSNRKSISMTIGTWCAYSYSKYFCNFSRLTFDTNQKVHI